MEIVLPCRLWAKALGVLRWEQHIFIQEPETHRYYCLLVTESQLCERLENRTRSFSPPIKPEPLLIRKDGAQLLGGNHQWFPCKFNQAISPVLSETALVKLDLLITGPLATFTMVCSFYSMALLGSFHLVICAFSVPLCFHPSPSALFFARGSVLSLSYCPMSLAH